MRPCMSIAEIEALITREFPQVRGQFTVQEITSDGLRLKMHVDDSHLRPGGTVSGPAMFALADCAFYLATLAFIGPQALAVTTSCSIDFMRKPPPGDLWAQARILKLGRVLSVGDVLVFSEAAEAAAVPVARASLTYSIPPKAAR